MMPHPKDTPLDKWSPGWLKMEVASLGLRLIAALTLSEVLLNYVGVSCNLEVLDEPTKGLSKGGVTDLVELLADRARRFGKCIWFTDHHVVESNRFSSTTTVVKTKSGSIIEGIKRGPLLAVLSWERLVWDE